MIEVGNCVFQFENEFAYAGVIVKNDVSFGEIHAETDLRKGMAAKSKRSKQVDKSAGRRVFGSVNFCGAIRNPASYRRLK